MVSKFTAKPELAELAIELRNKFGLTVFVETGTLGGETTRWASTHFATVYTIEKHPITASNAVGRLADCKNVTVIKGDSRQKLKEVLDRIGNKRALLWLDAHLTGPAATTGITDECALREELRLVASCRVQHCIFIDDAGWFFHARPSAAVDSTQWPDYKEIEKILAKWDLEILRGTNVISATPKVNSEGK